MLVRCTARARITLAVNKRILTPHYWRGDGLTSRGSGSEYIANWNCANSAQVRYALQICFHRQIPPALQSCRPGSAIIKSKLPRILSSLPVSGPAPANIGLFRLTPAKRVVSHRISASVPSNLTALKCFRDSSCHMRRALGRRRGSRTLRKYGISLRYRFEPVAAAPRPPPDG